MVKLLLLVAVVSLLAGCALASSTSSEIENSTPTSLLTTVLPTHTDSPVPATDTPEPPTPTNTPLPPTDTPTPEPSLTSTPTVTPSATPTDTATPTVKVASVALPGGVVDDSVRIFLISQNTGGSICGDSAVSIKTSVVETNDIEKNVEAALKQLLGIRSTWAGNLYNPLANSNLKLAEVKFNRGSGVIMVRFRGEYVPTGDPCDNTRVRAQVWSTIKQFRGIKSTNIYLNNMPFGDRLSNGK